jgi:hypothetical protein
MDGYTRERELYKYEAFAKHWMKNSTTCYCLCMRRRNLYI